MRHGSLRVLHAIHDFLPGHRAGSEIYAARLAAELQRRHHVTMLAAEYDPGRAHGSIDWRLEEGLTVVEIVNNWSFRSFAESYASARLDETLAHVLEAVDPDVVHLHSLLNLSFGLPALARARGARVVATLHDYTLVCPSGGQRLHRAEGHLCRTIDPSRCARCFRDSPEFAQMAVARAARGGGASPFTRRAADLVRRRAPGLAARLAAGAARVLPGRPLAAGELDERLQAARTLLRELDWIVAPSASIAEEFAALGAPAERIEVRDYGFPPLRRSSGGTRSGETVIGYVGSLVEHKGVHVLIEAARRLPASGWRLVVFGDPAVAPRYSERLRAAAEGLPVELRGRHDGDPADAYAELDLLVVPSLWLENSPLVVHEAFQCGVPVVGSRIGGIPGLVRDGVDGLLFEAGSVDDLAACLARLIRDPGLRARLARAAPPVESLEADAAAWSSTYARLVDGGAR